MGEWFGGDREERTRRCKLQYALALRMWQFEWAKIARLGQRPLVIGGTRSRVCVRSFAGTPSHEIRTGGQDDGRWDALGNRRWHSLTHSPTYPTSLPSHSTLYRFSFIHKKFCPLVFLSFFLFFTSSSFRINCCISLNFSSRTLFYLS